MTRFVKRRNDIGLPPGSVPVSKETGSVTSPVITVINWDEKSSNRYNAFDMEEALASVDHKTPTWIHLEGRLDKKMIQKLADGFGLSPLDMEDLIIGNQRPRLDDGKTPVLTIFRLFEKQKGSIEDDQIGFLLGKKFLFTLTEKHHALIDRITERIEQDYGLIRNRGCDYLFFALLDLILDGTSSLIEDLGEGLESLEEEILDNPDQDTLKKLYRKKNTVLFLSRSLIPLREVVNKLKRSEADVFTKEIRPFMVDLSDQLAQIRESLVTYREIMSNMLDMYLSSANNRMNEVMKVLTVIGTIFIPLTFITGLYGMNFVFMPELQWRWGYFAVLGILVVTGVSLFLYFKKKKWF